MISDVITPNISTQNFLTQNIFIQNGGVSTMWIFFAREIELFLCNCEIKMHEFSSSFTVLFFITEKARYKFLIMFLIIIVIITIIIVTGLQCNCAIFVLILFLFLSFSFSVIAWSSKFIGIRFLDKKNREGHKN